MKKICLLILCLVSLNCYAVDQWNKNSPDGENYAADIDTLIKSNNEALDRLNIVSRTGLTCIYSTVSEIKVLTGTIAIPNSGGTIVRWRRITSDTTVNWGNIDTGSEAVSTQYYVYAVADTDATTCTFLVSTNATSPTGATYYKKIGYFYNNASGDIVNVGNLSNGQVPNIIWAEGSTEISIASGTPADIDDMVLYLVSSGRPVRVTVNLPVTVVGNGVYLIIEIATSDKRKTYYFHSASGSYSTSSPMYIDWVEQLAAGTYTIKAQWSGTGTHYGNPAGGDYYGTRFITAEEL